MSDRRVILGKFLPAFSETWRLFVAHMQIVSQYQLLLMFIFISYFLLSTCARRGANSQKIKSNFPHESEGKTTKTLVADRATEGEGAASTPRGNRVPAPRSLTSFVPRRTRVALARCPSRRPSSAIRAPSHRWAPGWPSQWQTAPSPSPLRALAEAREERAHTQALGSAALGAALQLGESAKFLPR